ncbi:MAG: hypothetical protein HYX68_23615 [Planctomycetes bacterium]|nr:hypothetical protein [Planctomycetota bacterium]
MGVLSTAEAQLTIIAFEVFLGLWLWISAGGANALGPWLAAVLTFTIFACVTFYLGWVGQSSCRCLGRYSPSPWYAFGLDVFVLALLLVGRPDLTALRANPRVALAANAYPGACGLGSVALLTLLLALLPMMGFGPLGQIIGKLGAHRVTIQPGLAQVEPGAPGQQREISVEIANWTDEPIRLIGGTADCSCTVLHDLPITIAPNETRSVAVRIALSGQPGIFTRKAAFLVDDQGFKEIGFTMTGRILKNSERRDMAAEAR